MSDIEYDRVIMRLREGTHRVYIIRDARLGNYRVELWLNGQHIKKEDYTTQSKAAAIAKAEILHEGL